jgi:hypothetical protein
MSNIEDDDQAGFSITKVDYNPPRPVVNIVTSSNILVMALDNGKLIRLDLRDTSDLRDVDVGPLVRKMFLDPTGNHLIISTVEDTQYLNRSWNHPKPLKTLKNVTVTSVGWDLANTDANNTGNILFGTANGQIYEMSIEASSATTMLRSLERGVKMLYTFPDADASKAAGSASGPIPAGPHVIDGLGWFKVPGTRTTTHCVFASSASRIWQFVGGATFEGVFAAYANVPPYGVYHTLPNEGAGTKTVEMHFYHKYLEQQTLWPKSLAWFLAPSPSAVLAPQSGASVPYSTFHEGAWMANFSFADVASGKLEQFIPGGLGTQNPSGASSSTSTPHAIGDVHQINVIDSFKHVPLSDKPDDAVSTSMVLTEFHYIVLYHNGLIQFISRLTNELVFECKCNVGRSTMRGLAHDPRTNITFAYTENQLFEVHIDQESRNVWRMYLRNGQYDLAEQYAREDWQRDAIWTAAANHYFAQKLYKIAAEIYAKTMRSFEEVALKFMHENATPALMVYLKEKLRIGHFQSEMQPTVLCTWLTELYLSKLNDIEAQQQLLQGTAYAQGASYSGKGPSLQALKDQFDSIQEEFKAFLHQYEATLNRPTIMGLITSYGRVEEMLEYARVVKAFDVIVAWHIQQHDWSLALQELRQRRLTSLLYKHCPALMQHAPDATVNTLIEFASLDLDPREVLPSLLRYQALRKLAMSKPAATQPVKPLALAQRASDLQHLARGENHAIRFLEYVIHHQGNKDSAVHNLLIALYAEEEPEGGEEKLLRFVVSPMACIDLEYALGLCEKHGKLKAQVAIYSKMGLYQEAVALALKGNFFDLARATADDVEDEELRKSLWLELAEHVIKKDASHDIAKVMQFIQKSGILKIEDVLPIFPPFVVINDFKDEICRSLKEYNSHINDLVLEIEDSTAAAQMIRSDIDRLPNKFGAISSNQTCELCRTPILSKSFYLFPCTHVYHQNCLVDYLKPLILDPEVKHALITVSDALTQARIALAQRAAMERDRDSAFASSAAPAPSAASSILSFFDRDSNGDSSTLSRILEASPFSDSIKLPFGRDSSSSQSGQSSSSSQNAQSSSNPFSSSSTSNNFSSNHSADHHAQQGRNPSNLPFGGAAGASGQAKLPPPSVLATWTEKQLQDELDQYIACECPLCGDLMIESVPMPLVDAKTSASLGSQ